MLYTLSILGVVFAAVFLLWHFRQHLVDHLPRSLSSRLRDYAPLSTFEDAAQHGTQNPCSLSRTHRIADQLSCMWPGFSTANFDIAGNLADDSRAGLDATTLTEIRRIMERNRVDFDEARRLHTTAMFARNGER